MEFFQFVTTAQYLLEAFGLFQLDVEEVAEALAIIYREFLICVGIGAGVYVLLTVLGGIGLMKMAKRAGVPHAWMGFVPFLNTWYAGKLAGEAHFFGQKMKRAGLYAAIAEGLYSAVSAISLISSFVFLQYSDEGVGYNQLTGESYRTIEVIPSRIPQGLRWLYDFRYGFEVIGALLDFILVVMLFVLFIAFFRKYYARGPILMAFLCALLPFRGITIFAVRNNAPVDYDEYMRRRMEEMARRSQQQYGPQGPYGSGPYGNGPYGNGPYGSGPYGGAPQQPKPPEDPFSDFDSGNGGSGAGGNGAGGGQDASGGGTPPSDDPFSDF